jgi:hypothetical protein
MVSDRGVLSVIAIRQLAKSITLKTPEADRQPVHSGHSGASSLLPWLPLRSTTEALAALRTLDPKRVDPAQIAWWNRVPTLRADCVERCHDHGAIDLCFDGIPCA